MLSVPKNLVQFNRGRSADTGLTVTNVLQWHTIPSHYTAAWSQKTIVSARRRSISFNALYNIFRHEQSGGNPPLPPHVALARIERLVALCKDEAHGPKILGIAAGTPESYFAAILHNSVTSFVYLQSIDSMTFIWLPTTADPKSAVGRGREAVITLARQSADWMDAALALLPQADVEEDLAEAADHLSHLREQIDAYRAGVRSGASQREVEWDDISGVTFGTYTLIRPALKKRAH